MDDIRIKVEKAKELFVCGKEMKTMKVTEAFISLRTALEKAVSYKFGKDAFSNDFSRTEVIVGYHSSPGRLSSYDTQEYEKTAYKIDGKGNVTFTGPIVKVTKRVNFENKSAEDWLALKIMDRRIASEAEKMKNFFATCRSIISI